MNILVPVVKQGILALLAEIKKNRIFEHRGFSFRTNRQLMNPSFKKISKHSQTFDHMYNETDFNILYKARNNSELRVAESLFIHKNRPSLNSNESTVTLLSLKVLGQ